MGTMPEEDRRGVGTLLRQRQVNTYARTGQERWAPWVRRTGSGKVGKRWAPFMISERQIPCQEKTEIYRWALRKIKKRNGFKEKVSRGGHHFIMERGEHHCKSR
jgi:hypothetical protein